MYNKENTSKTANVLFEPVDLRHITLKNRIIRSATYEGYGDAQGVPDPGLADVYCRLGCGGVGAIITGFVFVSPTGRAMQPGQCGMESDAKIAPWQDIVDKVHAACPEVRLFMQIAHAGRQTQRRVTGVAAVGASARRCTYLKEPVKTLTDQDIRAIVDQFGDAAQRAQKAGFDGVQLHAAHGYLIHQFLSPWTNNRPDQWAEGPLLLERIIGDIRKKCGSEFPVLVKLSWADDNQPGINLENTLATVQRLEQLDIDAVEISYGTMEFALNIFRGACPVDTILKVNPLFNRIPVVMRRIWKRWFLGRYLQQFIPFSENYNVEAALKINEATTLPVIPVGGIRTADSMTQCIENGLVAIAVCRPLICEPDFPHKLLSGKSSTCTNCNLCTAHCDSTQTLRCYKESKNEYR